VSRHLPPSSALGNLRRQLVAGAGSVRRVRCGRLDVVRDFVPAPAVADAVLRLLRAPAPGQALNLCSGVGIELGAIFEAMARRLGVELDVVVDPELAALPAAPAVIGDPTALRRLLRPRGPSPRSCCPSPREGRLPGAAARHLETASACVC
jgi:nucleoside-diphosphate-sugar epimerase